ncbi:transposase domain-containing protein, partial [Cereibacter sediminicola]|uniref:transposase domain-containing protein n=1 Tax=Cereibacter sediminicola TaxID=2584941 RepID=UPI0011A61674
WVARARQAKSSLLLSNFGYAYLLDLFTRLANGHLDKDIDALMPWAYIPAANTKAPSQPVK